MFGQSCSIRVSKRPRLGGHILVIVVSDLCNPCNSTARVLPIRGDHSCACVQGEFDLRENRLNIARYLGFTPLAGKHDTVDP